MVQFIRVSRNINVKAAVANSLTIRLKITISDETKQLINRLLLERISLRGIARVIGVSWSWLQDYVNQKMSCVPRQIRVSDKSKGKLIIECDEMWSFVKGKKNEVYIWLAIDRDTRKLSVVSSEIELENGSVTNHCARLFSSNNP